MGNHFFFFIYKWAIILNVYLVGDRMIDKKRIIALIEMLFILIVSFIVFNFGIMIVDVNGESMYPTLHDNDYAFMSRVNKSDLDRFDIVTLDCKDLNKIIIKRVIGLPGDKIVYLDDKLYINDEFVKEDFLDKVYVNEMKIKYNTDVFTNDFEYVVGEDEVFVLGDNRVNSMDSRNFGGFKLTDIMSKKGMVVYPFKYMKEVE